MSLLNSLYRLVGRAGAGPAPKPDSSPGTPCPDVSDIFTYMHSNPSPDRRAEMESHFAACDDCRELIALFIKVPDEKPEGYDALLAPIPEDAVKKQAARVLAFIENDESQRQSRADKQHANDGAARKREGIYIPYPVLTAMALIVCAIAAGTVYLFSVDRRPEDAMDALRLAVKDERRTPARVSGLPYSPYNQLRGEVETEELQFQRAFEKVDYAKDESAPVNARLTLARVHLSSGKTDRTKKALAILQQVIASGHQSAEILNDLGVAQFQLGNYGAAIENFTKALEKSPNFNEALFNRALAENQASLTEAAKEDWQQFIRSTSDEKWRKEAEKYLGSLPDSSESNKR